MKPYRFQREAVKRIVAELRRANRAKAIMPCGTGKTLVGMLVRKALQPRRSLVAAPSLALVKQLLDSYTARGVVSRVLVVCSDDTTAKAAREKYEIPTVTTDPKAVAKALRGRRELIVFSTYQSTPRIAEAYQTGRVPWFDFAMFDEAHRMAGTSTAFRTALDDTEIPIRKRLFMTATPRVATRSAQKQADEDGYTFASMDDESQFGREAFYLSFNEAIENGYLTDYRLVVFFVRESEIHSMVAEDDDAKELAKRVALIKAMAEHDIRKVLAYHRTVRKMKHFAGVSLPRTFEAFREAGVIDGELWSTGLDGTDHASVRKDRLTEFAVLNGDHRAVLSNCQVLQEGVDCPTVDGVCLVEPRTQPVDIVQIIGRAIRNSPGKKIASIILPVFVPHGVEDGEFGQLLHSSDFASVLDVIAALRSHDERVQGWAGSARNFSESTASGHFEFNIDLPPAVQKKFYDAITSRIVGSFANRNHRTSPLTEELVWEWMQEYHCQHEKWPTNATPGKSSDGSSWISINAALKDGWRCLPGGSSIAKLRKKMLGSSSCALSEELIWEWMRNHYRSHARWPTEKTCDLCPDGSTWLAISRDLRYGRRSLPGGSSFRRIREANTKGMSEAMIVRWMKNYFLKNGRWPNSASKGRCPNGMTWRNVDSSLAMGRNGLKGGKSISSIRRRITNDTRLGELTEDLIWNWMQAHLTKHGEYPKRFTKERCPDGSTWVSIDSGLYNGTRGLPGGSSLAKLRERMLKAKNR